MDMPKFGDAVADAPVERVKRKYTRRAVAPDEQPKEKRKYKKRAPEATPREYACFLGEDNDVQLSPLNGEGEAIHLTAADAIALAAFVDRHRAVLKA